jgi:hypothetical protein
MRRKAFFIALAVVLVPLGLIVGLRRPFPSDRTPDGAYLRITQAVGRSQPREFFSYLEEEAQWACFTIRDTRRKAVERVARSYPEPQRSQLLLQWQRFADAPDGSDVFVIYYDERGWSKRLRKDMSGIVKVDVEGERASIVTARGTRWPFRIRKNGIWGLTVFTAELVAEAEKATRDLAIVEAAANDYDRAAAASSASPQRTP